MPAGSLCSRHYLPRLRAIVAQMELPHIYVYHGCPSVAFCAGRYDVNIGIVAKWRFSAVSSRMPLVFLTSWSKRCCGALNHTAIAAPVAEFLGKATFQLFAFFAHFS